MGTEDRVRRGEEIRTVESLLWNKRWHKAAGTDDVQSEPRKGGGNTGKGKKVAGNDQRTSGHTISKGTRKYVVQRDFIH
jgi:hypothetical protein